MNIHPQTGVITWVPPNYGTFHVDVSAQTFAGSEAIHSFKIDVHEIDYNLPPRVYSKPGFWAVTENTYQYQVVAFDPNDDSITYSLGTHPQNMEINSEGLITWVPGSWMEPQLVEVIVADDKSQSKQSYLLSVRGENNAPNFESTPPTNKILLGGIYRYKPLAIDPDGDMVTYQVLESSGLSTTITANGTINFLHLGSDTGTFNVSIEASDPFGATVVQEFPIVVAQDKAPPVVHIFAPAEPMPINSTVQVQVSAIDDFGLAGMELKYKYEIGNPSTNWTPVPLSADGLAIIPTPDKAGSIELQAKAIDLANNSSTWASATVTVVNLGPQNGTPTVSFTGDTLLALSKEVTAPLSIQGKVVDGSPGTLTWKLNLRADGSNSPITIRDGSSTVSYSGEVGVLNPTMLPEGGYTLTLIGSRVGGGSALISLPVRIGGHLKVGNLAFGVTDMTVSAAGVPITITRSYDSIRAHEKGPLGGGWSVSATAGRARSNVVSELVAGAGAYPPFKEGNRMTITLPDGSVEGFTLGYQKTGNWSTEYRPYFQADGGVRDKLIIDSSETLLSLGSGAYMSGYGDVYNPFNPVFGGGMILRTRSGQEFHYVEDKSAAKGTAGKLVSMTDRHGNRLDFSSSGVHASTPILQPNGSVAMIPGNSVTFLWNASHTRIVGVQDPRGAKVMYQYDTLGYLIGATDRVGNQTTYHYFDDGLHHRMLLDEVRDPLYQASDPLKHVTLKAKYNTSGRVETLTDAAGKSATRNYSNDLNGPPAPGAALFSESATVGEGAASATTMVVYDERGNVKESHNPLGMTTFTEFGNPADPDSRDLPMVITQKATATSSTGLTTSIKYDNNGSVTSTTDPRGGVTAISYDSFGQPITISDPENHITVNQYDPVNGDLLSTTSPEGVVSNFKYDEAGNATSVQRGDAESKFSYDKYGRMASQISSTGVLTTNYVPPNMNARVTTTWRPGFGNTAIVTEYDAEDRVIKEIDVYGHTATTNYNALGHVTSTVDVHGNVTNNFYDIRGLLVQSASPGAPNKMVTRTVYDDLGRAEWTLDAKPADTIDYQPTTGQTVTLTGPGTHTKYDKDGRVTATERYDAVAVQLSKSSNQTYATAIKVDATTGKQVTGKLLSTTQTHFDDFGRVDWTIDGAGAKTETTFDELGRAVKVTTAAGTALAISGYTGYDAAGRVQWTLSPSDVLTSDGKVQYVKTQTEYDGDGRVLMTIAAGTTYWFASNGDLIPSDNTYPVYTYVNGNLVISQGTGINSYDPAGNVITFHYDDQGRKDWEIDVLGRKTEFDYDASGRLKSVTQPDVADENGAVKSPVTKYDYDASGNMTKITDALGRETTFTFNKYGQQTKRFLPDPVTAKAGSVYEEKVYNTWGDLDYSFDFNGAKVDEVYDYDLTNPSSKLGQLVSLKRYAPGATNPAEWDDYLYDPYGRRSKVTQHNGDVYEYGYDEESRLKTEISPAGTINYGYNDLGQHTVTWTNKSNIEYGYDQLGRLEDVTVLKRNGAPITPDVTSYTYTPAGNVATINTSANSVTIRESTYDYDATRPWGTKLTHVGGDDDVLSQFQYQRAKDGQITRVDETVLQPSGAPTATGYFITTSRYEYDTLNRLKEEQTDADYYDGGDYTTTYKLDLVGNRREEIKVTGESSGSSATATITASLFDARDRLLVTYSPSGTDSIGNVTTAYDPTFYQYDKNGQQTAQTSYAATVGFDTIGMPVTPSTTAITSSQLTAWNLRGQITDVTVTTASKTESVHYDYNPDGIRTRDAVADGSVTTTTMHLVDSNNSTGHQQDIELFEDGALVETIIAGLELLSRTGRDHDGTNWQAALTSFYLTDIHSGVRQRLANIGLIASTRYSAFGATASWGYIHIDPWYPTKNLDPNQHLYRGEYRDPITGAQYLRARWYDLETGRFSRIDPASRTYRRISEINRYGYAADNPINECDPTGMWGLSVGSFLVGMGFLGTIGSLTNQFLIRHASPRDGQLQLPFAGHWLDMNYHAIKVKGSDVSADEAFEILASWNWKTSITRAMGGPITGAGQTLTFEMSGMESSGQRPFDVRVDTYSKSTRTISAVTLGGHPLRGFRYWRIVPDNGNGRSHNFKIETGAVDHPNLLNDYLKVDNSLAHSRIMRNWSEMIGGLARQTGGTIVNDGTTFPNGVQAGNGIMEGDGGWGGAVQANIFRHINFRTQP